MTPEQQLYLANRAKEVVENEAYIAAFEAIKEEILLQWKTSPARDADGREKLWLMQSLLQKLQLCLESTMDGGKLAKAELQHRQTLAERAKDWLR
jgi:hypothetical protein